MEKTSQSPRSIPHGVEIFFSVIGLISYAGGALLLFCLLYLLTIFWSVVGLFPVYLLLFSLLFFCVAEFSAFAWGYALVSKKRWILPVMFIGLVVGTINNVYLLIIHSSSVAGTFSIIGIVVALVLGIAFVGLTYAYRDSFNGSYFHPFYSIFYIIILIGSMAFTHVNSTAFSGMLNIPSIPSSSFDQAQVSSENTPGSIGFTITPALGWKENASTSNPLIISSPDGESSLLVSALPISSGVTLDSLATESAPSGVQLNKSIFSHNYPGLVSQVVDNKPVSKYTRVLYTASKAMLYQLYEISYTAAGLDSSDFTSMVSSFTLTN